MGNITPIAQAIQAVLGQTADQLGRDTGFIQREVKLTGSSFVKTLVFAFQANPAASYGELSQTAAALGVAISPQGLEQRFSEEAAHLVRKTLEAAVAQGVEAQGQARGLLQQFAGVYIRDGSTISLPFALKEVWRGVGGSQGESAALKLQVNLDYNSGQVHGPVLQEGRVHDHNSPYQSELLPVGALHLADLGFFDLERLAEDQSRGVYWITRLKGGSALYDPQGQRLSLLEWLLSQEAGIVETTVQLGRTQRIPCRLVTVRVPQEVADQRRRRLREWARKKQRAVSERQMRLASWTLVVTNVPAAMLSAEQVLRVLGVRWQVELLFKLWKSHAKVDEWRSENPWRILCEIYAKLLALVVTHWLLMISFAPYVDRSLAQGAKTVQKFAFSILSALHDLSSLVDILSQLSRCLMTGCRKQKRKTHPATFQLVLGLA